MLVGLATLLIALLAARSFTALVWVRVRVRARVRVRVRVR